jgi:hypothetical protein
VKRQIVIIVSIALASFLIGTLFSMGSTASGVLPNPFENRVNNTSELQAQIDSLNATLTELQKKMRIEIIRLTEPNEINITNHNPLANGLASINTATLVWNPKNPENNTILSIHCNFELRRGEGIWVGQSYFTDIVINGDFDSPDCEIQVSRLVDWTLVSFQISEGRTTNDELDVINSWVRPNQESYNITFRTWITVKPSVPTYVRNINIIMEVIDGNL